MEDSKIIPRTKTSGVIYVLIGLVLGASLFFHHSDKWLYDGVKGFTALYALISGFWKISKPFGILTRDSLTVYKTMFGSLSIQFNSVENVKISGNVVTVQFPYSAVQKFSLKEVAPEKKEKLKSLLLKLS